MWGNTPEQEAEYALKHDLGRAHLSMAAQLAYDRLTGERGTTSPDQPLPESLGPSATAPPARSSPEVRARILEMFKRLNSKYARPFENDRLAVASFAGGNWEEYGAIVLQMAILDTLLSIEEKLSAPEAGSHAASE
jgi:hypothetical protein